MNNFQLQAFDKLNRLKVGALFMEMGTGKTKVALDLMSSKAHKCDSLVWICPCSLKNEIKSEWMKWHPELNLTIVGCESIGSSDRIYMELFNKIKQSDCSFIVVDESLKIKNQEAKRTQRILKLGTIAKYKLILNGTPISRNVLDLWTQMYFLSPKILNMSYSRFKNTYTEYYVRGELKGKVKKQHNIAHLISLIEPYIFDCELELEKKKIYKNIPYSMDELELMEYEEIKEKYLDRLEFTDLDFYSLTTELQQFYTGTYTKVLNNTIDEIDGQVIVFVKFLKNIPSGAKSLTGDATVSERAEIIKDFRNGKFKVLYVTYGVGAYGLNLQFCHNMIFADHTFDYSQQMQAEARIYRMGQSEDVTYYNLWCTCGLEGLIQGSLDKKSNLLDEIKKEIEKEVVGKWIKNL